MHRSAGITEGEVRPSAASRQSGVAYVAQIERLEVAVTTGMEEYEYGHHLTIGHEACMIAAAFTGAVQSMFFQFKSKIFAKLIENTEDFY